MLNCFDVAEFFLAQQDDTAGDLISNLKLQKLVYYAQGFHLAIYNRPLFPEKIKAWIYGPAVPELFRFYKEYGENAIPCPTDIDWSKYDEETLGLLNEVYSVFGQFSAWKLRNMALEEYPWKDASRTAGEITHQSLKDYFKTQLNHESEAV